MEELINLNMYESIMTLDILFVFLGGFWFYYEIADEDKMLPALNVILCFSLLAISPVCFIGSYLEDREFVLTASRIPLVSLLSMDCACLIVLKDDDVVSISGIAVNAILLCFVCMTALIPDKAAGAWKIFSGIICLGLSAGILLKARRIAEDADRVFLSCISSLLSTIFFVLNAWRLTGNFLCIPVIIFIATGKITADINFFLRKNRSMICLDKYDPIYFSRAIKLENPLSKGEMLSLLDADAYLKSKFPFKRFLWKIIISDWNITYPDLAAAFSTIHKSDGKTALLNMLIYAEYAFMRLSGRENKIKTVTSDLRTIRIELKKGDPILLPVSRFKFDFEEDEGICDTPVYDLSNFSLTVPQIK